MKSDETVAEWAARMDANAARLEARTHYVYRAHDAAGRLLYIGCTVNLPGRMNQHRRAAEWWQFVTDLTVETFPCRTAARAAEEQAIATEGAYFNHFPGNQFTANTPPSVGAAAYRAACETDVAA
jgi:predicted GIY-YIG superfamily endonuclease